VILEPSVLAFLCAASVATGALSAVVGMAGGMTLLALMLLWLEPAVAIPVHGVVQLVSNSSRSVAQWPNVRFSLFARFALPLLPCAFAGLAASRAVPRGIGAVAIGVFVLIATWRPGWLRFGGRGAAADPNRRMLAAGSVVGFFSTTIGATGPLLAPFFLHLGLGRKELIGTQAACQAYQHLAKIVLFGAAGFAFRAWLWPLAALSCTATLGTWLGTLLLDRVSEDDFRALYTGVLTVLALRLMSVEIASWIA
jgi:uncharacterized membrane protein YfcA